MYHGFRAFLPWKGAKGELTPRVNGRQQSRKERKCAVCESRQQSGTVEIFQFLDELDTYIFNTGKAKEMVADGRSALPIPAETVRLFAGMNECDLDHLGHVDPEQPGIFTRRLGGLILLDGTHRATRCFAEKRQFFAFELTYEESLECLVQQRVSAKDAAAIVRKLRRAWEFFPGSGPVDTPIECSSEVLREVEKQLTAAER
ncbi:MAG TPA: hypothetical protein VGJ51_19315, partial [Candidatus Angelobacter sp.]